MAEKYNFQRFLSFVSKNEWEQALEYKNRFIPNRLYHYFTLFDKAYFGYRKKNKERLVTLKNKELWVSSCDALNDPFEFNGLFFEPSNNKVLQENADNVEKVLTMLKKSFQIFLSDNFDSNMPLWAHYANNHKGYCVEYSVTNLSNIFPVSYCSNRESAPNMLTTIFTELVKNFKGGKKPSGKFWRYFLYLFISFMLKHDLWEYEGEYRMFYEKSNRKEGQLVNLSDANLKIEKIYVGFKCEYKKELDKIGRELGIEVHEMILDKLSTKFSLRVK